MPNIPAPKNAIETRPLRFGPYFSTYLPRKPAEKPRKRIAMENAHVVSDSDQPSTCMIGRVSTLQA